MIRILFSLGLLSFGSASAQNMPEGKIFVQRNGLSQPAGNPSTDPIHFTPIDPTGDARPVVVEDALIDQAAITEGDEIGVFDGGVCVGATSFTGSFPVAMTIWMEVALPGGTVLPGAHAGNSMVFKVWRMNEDRELGATPSYVQGGGNFGESLTVVNPLEASATDHFTPIDPTGEPGQLLVQIATIDDSGLLIGDEIGVFDGGLCVGAIKFLGSYPVALTAWIEVTLPNTTVLQGATTGNSMSFKLWQANTNIELSAQPIYSTGNGIFGEAVTAVGSLSGATSTTHVTPPAVLPDELQLSQNYPNPFNPETTIRYYLPKAAKVNLTVYNLRGRPVRHLDAGLREAGSHQVLWDGRDDQGNEVAAGVYFYRLAAAEFAVVKKLTFMK